MAHSHGGGDDVGKRDGLGRSLKGTKVIRRVTDDAMLTASIHKRSGRYI